MKIFGTIKIKTGVSLIIGACYVAVIDSKSIVCSMPTSLSLLIHNVRGGGVPTTIDTNNHDPIGTNIPKRKKRKSKPKSGTSSKAKKAINRAMKEKDSAEALGDAIRERADTLLEDKFENDPLLKSINESVASVGRAMGVSDYNLRAKTQDSSGGVQTAPTALIVNYFFKSHGGAHLMQSASSLLATSCAIATLYLTSKYSNANANMNAKWTLVLLRRTLIFAMIKHISGLLASASMVAKAIPEIGISQSRVWMEEVVQEPVAQYVFYTALLLLWLPSKLKGDGSHISTIWWWSRQRWIIPWFVGPILLREVVSNILIVSDILVLWTFGCCEKQSTIIERILQISQSIINSIMSLLVSPTLWSSAAPTQRQAILAGLISKISLLLEAGVGGIMMMDFFVVLFQLVFGAAISSRPAWHEALTKIIAIRLFLHYLVYLRRKKLSKLAKAIRGGAQQLPFFVLDSLYDPAKAIGILTHEIPKQDFNKDGFSWKDYLSIGLGLDP